MFFAVLVVIVFGILAVTVDLGMTNTTRLQMQRATDAAANEGIRFRDDDAIAPTARDEVRRILASQAVVRTYDWDGDIATNDDDLDGELGAGPLYRVTGGVGDLDAGGLLELGDPGVGISDLLYVLREDYEPQTYVGADQPIWLALNLEDNEYYGDLVAGTYFEDGDHLDGYFSGGWVPYDRTSSEGGDFDASDAGDVLDPESDAFLARMRRTREDQTPLDRVDGVSTAGPTIGYLFARGSMMQATDADGNSPRADGMTVRSTSIAQARRAITVGGADPVAFSGSSLAPLTGNGIVGLAPIAFGVDYWNSLPANAGDTLTRNPANGRLDSLITGVGPDGWCVLGTRLLAPAGAGATTLNVTVAGGAFDGEEFVVRIDDGFSTELATVVGKAGASWSLAEGLLNAYPAGARVIYSGALSLGTPRSFILADQVGGVLLVRDPNDEMPALQPVLLVPIIGRLDIFGNGSTPVVIGFGRVRIVRDDGGEVQLVKLPGAIASRNATSGLGPRRALRPTFGQDTVFDVLFATVEQDFPVVSPLSESDETALIDQLFLLNSGFSDPVLAPAMVRSYGP